MDNKFFICENINIFGYLRPKWGGGGASISILGPSWFTYTLSFILNYMSNTVSNLIRTISVKIKNMKKIKIKESCWVLTSNPGVPGEPKCQQMQTSSQWRPNV